MEQVLTLNQRAVIQLVAQEPELRDFYLTGGTALAAYYIGHRHSDDLDFFIADKPDLPFLHDFARRIQSALHAKPPRYRRLYDRNEFFFATEKGELKIEFTRYPFPQFEVPQPRDGMRIDSLRDLTANKLMTMLDRFEPKDFIDLYFLLREKSLADVVQDVQTKFSIKVTPLFLGQELMKVRRIEALPTMLKSLTIEELKRFFAEQARALGPEVLE